MLTNNTKERVTITPEMAKEMLTHNTNNRPVKKRQVEKLYMAIIQGLWNYDGTPIRFDILGNLIDGQHRLLACVKAGIPIICDIKYNLPVESFKTIDTSLVPRGAKDLFALHGVCSYSTMSAIVNSYIQLCAKHNLMCTQEKHMHFCSMVGLQSVTPESLYLIYKENEDVFYPCSRESINNYSSINLISGSVEGAIMAFLIIQKHHPSSKVFDFFNQLHHIENARYDVIRCAYNRLIKHRTGQQLCTAQMIQATIIKAWNAYITNKDRKTITFYPDKEEMPEWI